MNFKLKWVPLKGHRIPFKEHRISLNVLLFLQKSHYKTNIIIKKTKLEEALNNPLRRRKKEQ